MVFIFKDVAMVTIKKVTHVCLVLEGATVLTTLKPPAWHVQQAKQQPRMEALAS